MPVIKRYGNRKLYDTRAKRYITLEALADLIRRGDDVRVVDHASGEDITDLTLAQIIFAQEKKEKGGLPRIALKSMIQAGNQALAHMRGALPWSDGGQTEIDDEIARRVATLIEWGYLTEEEGARLGEQMAMAGERPAETPGWDEATIERGLRERGVPTRTDIHALVERLEAVAAELDRLASQDGSPRR